VQLKFLHLSSQTGHHFFRGVHTVVCSAHAKEQQAMSERVGLGVTAFHSLHLFHLTFTSHIDMLIKSMRNHVVRVSLVRTRVSFGPTSKPGTGTVWIMSQQVAFAALLVTSKLLRDHFYGQLHLSRVPRQGKRSWEFARLADGWKRRTYGLWYSIGSLRKVFRRRLWRWPAIVIKGPREQGIRWSRAARIWTSSPPSSRLVVDR
jgi:hypothetical protein